MADTREKFSRTTLAFHWIVALSIIGMLALGLIMHELDRGELKSMLYGWHKVIGTTILLIAVLRILWRWRNGMPEPAGDYPAWQHKAAVASHIALLTFTLMLPLSGALYSYGAGYPVPVLGLFEIVPAGKIPWLGGFMHETHEILGKILMAIIALHAAAALKHHFLEKDGTLRRMLGARIG